MHRQLKHPSNPWASQGGDLGGYLNQRRIDGLAPIHSRPGLIANPGALSQREGCAKTSAMYNKNTTGHVGLALAIVRAAGKRGEPRLPSHFARR